jgi:hypothetical protein
VFAVAPREGEKFELELVVAERKCTLLGVGLPVPMIAGDSDALEDVVVLVVSPAVDIYSAAEFEGTPGYTVAVVAAAVDNIGPWTCILILYLTRWLKINNQAFSMTTLQLCSSASRLWIATPSLTRSINSRAAFTPGPGSQRPFDSPNPFKLPRIHQVAC